MLGEKLHLHVAELIHMQIWHGLDRAFVKHFAILMEPVLWPAANATLGELLVGTLTSIKLS